MRHNERVGIDAIESYAQENNCSLAEACVVFKSPMLKNPEIWGEPVDVEDVVSQTSANLVSEKSTGLMARMAISISNEVSFPPSTAFLHGLGAVSSALNKGFKIKFKKTTIPLNLFVITAQRPSTGKSSINSFFMEPINRAYDDENKRTAVERMKLQRDLAMTEDKLEKMLSVKSTANEYEMQEAYDVIQSIKNKLKEIPEWVSNITNATIEATEMVAASQNGLFNIVSAEADAINVITGNVYGDAKSKKQYSIILSGWDNEEVKTFRVGRKGINCKVRGSISILAQADAVDTILQSSEGGRGVTERFLLLDEKGFLGYRTKGTITEAQYNAITTEYSNTVNNIVAERDVLIDFSPESLDFIQAVKFRMEPNLKEDGKYANDLIGGFMGKLEKHVMKIAAILHCTDEWRDSGNRSRIVPLGTTQRAYALFMELADRFLQAADFHGYTGERSEISSLVDYFTQKAEKGNLKLTMPKLRDNIKNTKAFKGTPALTSKLKNQVLPLMQKKNYIVVDGNTIHINPRLK